MISKDKKNNILITCVGGPLKSKELLYLKKISKYNNLIIGTDKNNNAIGKKYADKFYKVPNPDSSKYIKLFLNIVKKENINLIIPSSDEEAFALSKNMNKFKKIGCIIACSNFKTIKILSSKIQTYKHLKGTKVPLPLYFVVNKLENILVKTKYLLNKNYDVVIKPSISRGGRNVTIIGKNKPPSNYYKGSREEFMFYDQFEKKYKKYKDFLPVIVMEKLHEPTYDLDILAHNGKIIRQVARRRIKSKLPNDGHIIEKRRDIYKIASIISKKFNLNWLHDCDLMLDSKNKIKLLEINPRPSGSAIISMISGIPLLDDIIDLLKGKKIKKIPIPFNKKVYPKEIDKILLSKKI